MKNKSISRRNVLRLALTAGGLGAFAWLSRLFNHKEYLVGASAGNRTYMPLILKPAPTSTPKPTATPTSIPIPPGSGGVVHVHAANATDWNFSTVWFGDYVHQSIVDTMVDTGLRSLTGKTSIVEAWQALLPGYVPGDGIAIKVNLNNTKPCAYNGNIIDGLIEPVNSLVKGMVAMGVNKPDIWIYDASRPLPDAFRNRCLYYQAGVPDSVRFYSTSGGCATAATFDSTDPSAVVNFNNSNIKSRKLTDVIVKAKYLINMPILKEHGISGVTLGFKNHFGSIPDGQVIGGDGTDNLHGYIGPSTSNFNPLVNIYLNPNIKDKTRLIVGDGLFGARTNTNEVPQPWNTFGGRSPNSLFFSTDPVAVDCVMTDILNLESQVMSGADNYLKLAAQQGLGIYERRNPDNKYNLIDYRPLEIT